MSREKTWALRRTPSPARRADSKQGATYAIAGSSEIVNVDGDSVVFARHDSRASETPLRKRLG